MEIELILDDNRIITYKHIHLLVNYLNYNHNLEDVDVILCDANHIYAACDGSCNDAISLNDFDMNKFIEIQQVHPDLLYNKLFNLHGVKERLIPPAYRKLKTIRELHEILYDKDIYNKEDSKIYDEIIERSHFEINSMMKEIDEINYDRNNNGVVKEFMLLHIICFPENKDNELISLHDYNELRKEIKNFKIEDDLTKHKMHVIYAIKELYRALCMLIDHPQYDRKINKFVVSNTNIVKNE